MGDARNEFLGMLGGGSLRLSVVGRPGRKLVKYDLMSDKEKEKWLSSKKSMM